MPEAVGGAPLALVALGVIPIAAGAVRLAGLAGGAQVTPENARFAAAPVPVAIHIVGATAFSLLGALQFAHALRRRAPRWHRAAAARGYAIGLGAGTQALVHLPWLVIAGKPGVLGHAALMGAGWLINVAVAEWTTRRGAGPHRHAPRATRRARAAWSARRSTALERSRPAGRWDAS